MKCPNCGFDSAPELKYCGHCGALWRRSARVATLPIHLTTLLRDVWCPADRRAGRQKQQLSLFAADNERPSDCSSRVELEGERRVATVILADVRSSTDLMEQIGTEAWVEIMNRVLQILEAEIYRFGGRLTSFEAMVWSPFSGQHLPTRMTLNGLSWQLSRCSMPSSPTGLSWQTIEGIDLNCAWE